MQRRSAECERFIAPTTDRGLRAFPRVLHRGQWAIARGPRESVRHSLCIPFVSLCLGNYTSVSLCLCGTLLELPHTRNGHPDPPGQLDSAPGWACWDLGHKGATVAAEHQEDDFASAVDQSGCFRIQPHSGRWQIKRRAAAKWTAAAHWMRPFAHHDGVRTSFPLHSERKEAGMAGRISGTATPKPHRVAHSSNDSRRPG